MTSSKKGTKKPVVDGIPELAQAFATYGARAVTNSLMLDAFNEPDVGAEDGPADASVCAFEWAEDPRTAAGIDFLPRDKGAVLVIFSRHMQGKSGLSEGEKKYAVAFAVRSADEFETATETIKSAFEADTANTGASGLEITFMYMTPETGPARSMASLVPLTKHAKAAGVGRRRQLMRERAASAAVSEGPAFVPAHVMPIDTRLREMLREPGRYLRRAKPD